jgi:hypothetical protein
MWHTRHKVIHRLFTGKLASGVLPARPQVTSETYSRVTHHSTPRSIAEAHESHTPWSVLISTSQSHLRHVLTTRAYLLGGWGVTPSGAFSYHSNPSYSLIA